MNRASFGWALAAVITAVISTDVTTEISEWTLRGAAFLYLFFAVMDYKEPKK